MDPIIKLAASAEPGEKKYILFAGAGVSKDAGIPTAWDLMLETANLLCANDNNTIDPNVDLEEWFINSQYAQMEYAELIGEIYPKHPDQQSFLKNYLGNREVGQAHRGMAELAEQGIIRAIITTNFDHYIERALEEKGLDTQVISTDEDLENSEPLIQCKAVRIYKPHGTLGRGALKNTPKDLEKLSPLMEKELIRVLSEHGVLVLGYSGRDKGIQKVFKRRNYNYYPLFWVNSSPPKGEIENILKVKAKDCYIACTGASQFIDDYFRLLERLDDLAPTIGSGPTISDLKRAFKSPNELIDPLYSEYLISIFNDLERIKPDFSKFEHYDEAIDEQIAEGIPISYRFIEAAQLASRYKNREAIEAIYNFFGSALKLYYVPDSDGYKFLVFEMFVSFIATLIRHDNWEIIGDILIDDLFVEARGGRYFPFVDINDYLRSLDETRNKMADLLKERFNESALSELIEHREFLEADYFLFMRTVCHEEDSQGSYSTWCPRSCVVWLDKPPRYLIKSESKRFLEKIVKATGFEMSEDFVERLKEKHSLFSKYFPRVWPPLRDFDWSNLGTRR